MKILAKSLLVVAVLAAVFTADLARAAESGKPAPDFTLTDITGKTHTLSDYKGKVVVLEWVNPGCPVVQMHYSSGNMPGTQRAAAADGAVWLQINSAHPGAPAIVNYDDAASAEWQKKVGAGQRPYFRDFTGKVGRLYGAKATPHMFVIAKDGTLVYQGGIDDNPKAKESEIAQSKNYVKAALAALKAGKPIEKAAAPAYGCAVKYGKDT